MKDLIKYLLFTFVGGSILYALLVVSTFFYRDLVKWRLDADVTTVVFGNSTGEAAINDALLDKVKNLCKSGTPYTLNQHFITNVIEANPQIRTVLFCFDPFTYAAASDKGLLEARPSYFREYSGMVSYMGFNIFHEFNTSQILSALLRSNYLLYVPKMTIGYRRLTANNLHRGGWSAEAYDKAHPTIFDRPFAETRHSQRIEQHALRHVISFCLERGIRVTIIATPMYHIDRWFGRKGYEEFLSTLDERVFIADYSTLPMPSDEYYADVQHLNYKGATFFSEHIRKNGLQAIPLKEYLIQQAAARKMGVERTVH